MTKKIAGALIIIAALAAAAGYWLDGRPETQPDVPATIEQVKDGASLIIDTAAPAQAAPAAEQGESK
ncbi:MAG: hypothetical protein J6P03_08545 [Opitutales bacterium]|nr:hypothetical protein [Opitutales bacterium]